MSIDSLGKFDTYFNIEFDPKKDAQKVADDIKNAAKDKVATSLATLLAGGAGKENTRTDAASATTAKNAATTAKEFEKQKQLCTTAINTLTKLVQTGELDLSSFQTMLENEVIQTVKDSVTQSKAINDQINELNNQNLELYQKIQEKMKATGFTGNIEDVLSNPSSTENDKSSDGSNTSDNKAVDMDPELEDLIKQFNNNSSMITTLGGKLQSLSDLQDKSLEKEDKIKEQANQSTGNFLTNIKESANKLYGGIEDGINKIFNSGKTKQVAQGAEATVMATADTGAAAAKQAEAATETAGAFVSFGATGVMAAKAEAEALAFTTAALGNTKIAGFSASNILEMASGQQTIGKVVAGAIESKVNQGISSVVNEATTEIFGEDAAQYVQKYAPKVIDIAST